MRTLLGIFIGLLLAAGVLAGCGWLLTQQVHLLPAKFNWRSMYQVTEYIEAAPLGALALLCGAAGLAALIGAWPAARLADGHRGGAALAIGVPLTVLMIASAALVPQPDWVPTLGMLLPIPLAVLAWRTAIPKAKV